MNVIAKIPLFVIGVDDNLCCFRDKNKAFGYN